MNRYVLDAFPGLISKILYDFTFSYYGRKIKSRLTYDWFKHYTNALAVSNIDMAACALIKIHHCLSKIKIN